MSLRQVSALLFLSSLLAAQAAVADAPVAPISNELAEAIVREGIDKSQVMRFLRDLTGKVGHRLTGSDNFTKGCEWAKGEFEKMGLEVELEKWGEWKLVWTRGEWVGRITSPIQLDMYVATDAWTAGTKGLQKGAIVTMPGTDEALAESALAGKWVIGKRKLNEGNRKAAQAAGALGCVYRANDPDSKFPTRVRVFGNHQTAMKSLADVPTFPEIAVQADHFDQLWALVEEGKSVEGEFDIGNSFRDGPIVLNNVVATLKGTEKPDEMVIVSSHLDSWHQKQGTTDNGTGSTSTMEAARILTAVGAKPKRTIKFCLWGGEEQGLLGSRGFVQRHRADMPKVSAVFNHDTGTNWAQSLSVTQAMHDQLAPVFTHVNRLMKAPDADWDPAKPVFDLRVVKQVSGGGGSDHASFIAAGVPGLNWSLRGRSNYFEHTWHTQWDTIDVAIEEYQRHTSTIIALAALGTANLPALLDRAGVVTGGGGGGRGQSAAYVAGIFEGELDGLTITSLKDGGRGAKMGAQKGDVLKKVNGEEVTRTSQVTQLVRDAQGDLVTFTFQRGDKSIDATMSKKELPAAPTPPNRGDNRPRDTVPPGGGQPAPGGTGGAGGSPGGGSGGGSGSGGAGNGGGGGNEDAFGFDVAALQLQA